MSDSLLHLKGRMARIGRLSEANALLEWDQQTYMPPGASAARAEQSATLSELIHELFTAEETGRLLSGSEADTKGQFADSDDVRMLAVVRRNYDQATKLPADLVKDLARHTALSQDVWVRARKANDFGDFAPSLQKMLDLKRRQAECLGYTDHIYDALIHPFEPGMTQASVAAIFADMKPGLVALAHAIANSKNPVDDSILHGEFPVEKQRELTLRVVNQIGFDMERGRQDVAAHPFCTNFSRDDVRITTRFNTEIFSQALYASLHEAGHAMYEQGSPAEYEGTALAGGVSLGVHESQSRLWENLVGRSRAFSAYLFPIVSETFPKAFAGVDVESFYRAVNKVEPSLIRVEADEVTYNLHILMRFELECDLLTGMLKVADLPEAWNAKMREYLGITPPDNAYGVLQDVHWSAGLIGYFPTYTLGNLISAQLWQALRAANPNLDLQLAQGECSAVLSWLRENIHRYGQKYLPTELIQRATGAPLSSGPYLEYLTAKFGDIYRL